MNDYDRAKERLRGVIMDEIFDQKKALLALGCVHEMDDQMVSIKLAVNEREQYLENDLAELQAVHQKALDLLRDFARVVEHHRGADYHLLYQYQEFLEK